MTAVWHSCHFTDHKSLYRVVEKHRDNKTIFVRREKKTEYVNIRERIREKERKENNCERKKEKKSALKVDVCLNIDVTSQHRCDVTNIDVTSQHRCDVTTSM